VKQIEATQVDPVLLARTRLALADASWKLGNRKAARAAAEAAPGDLAVLPPTWDTKLRGEIATWLAKHPN
jgi:hypothetical protein